jgi:GNAT superfamily N-acetyltransferase
VSVQVRAHDHAQPAYVIRHYRPEDGDRVLAFLRMVLGEGGAFARTSEFFQWKHIENHFGPSQMMLADNHEILGVRAFMRWGFKTPYGPVRAVRAVDTATHPGYRRLGVFSRLTKTSLDQAKIDGVHLIFNTPNPASMAGYLKLGWGAVGHPRLLVRVLNVPRMVIGVLQGRRQRITETEIATFFRTPTRSVEELLAREERVAAILRLDDGLCRDGIRTERSGEFLRWRYVDAPSLKYFALWTGKSPVTGALIFRPNIRRGLREIMLCEFLVGYGAAPEVRALITTLARSVRADYIVAAATPGTEHWGLLRRSGFIPLPERAGPNFVAYPLNWPTEAPDPHVLAHWRLSLGDLEIF